ncbi:MAG: acyl-CoA dehydrogenase family protein [Bacteroidetes bacterium]|nr:acyl-CoA dehydrogenase family protein [Bacteroidota bacterium]
MRYSTTYFSTPGTRCFLPMLYTVWSDMTLTDTERATLTTTIQKQEWLSPEEKNQLNAVLDHAVELTAEDLKTWHQTISQHSGTPGEHLIELGMRVGQALNKEFSIPANALSDLKNIDGMLGIPGRESTLIFFPASRKAISSTYGTEPSFNIDNLKSILDGRDQIILDQIRKIISGNEFRFSETEDLDFLRAQTLKQAKILAAEGIGSLGYPKEYGGKGDLEAYFAAMEGLSYGDLSLVVKFGVQFGLWGMSVYQLGTEKHHQKYLRDIGTLKLPGCFAMTETGHGSNVKGIETTATYRHSDRSFIIHTPNEQARKEYIGNAALHGKMATVFAKIMVEGKDYGVGAFVVALRDDHGSTLPGITIKDCGRKLGLNGVDNGVIYFNQVTIPASEMLDRYAGVDDQGKFTSPIASDNRRFFTMLGALVGGRIGIPRSGLAATRTGLTIAIRYGDGRRQFGPEGGAEVPILNYRTHQKRLIPALASTYALHFALKNLTHRYIHRKESEMQEIEAVAAGLKALTTWHTSETLQTCRECCGGKGYLWENRIGPLKNDSDIYSTFEGDNTVLLQLVAKSRLTAFKQEFSSMNALGMLGYLAQQATVAITEMNPITTRNTDEEHLSSYEFYHEAFTFREKDTLTSAAKRLRRLLADGMDSFDAFNVCQQHMVDVGIAYIDRIVLEEFREAINTTQDEACRNVLYGLLKIFALSRLEKNKAYYLEQGYMEGIKTKAIRKLLSQLCWDIRKDAVPLVDAFGIPEACIHAPIAKRA